MAHATPSRLHGVVLGMALVLACARQPDDAREAAVANALAQGDEALLRSRPNLMRAKYDRMQEGNYAFMRGALPVFTMDWRLNAAGLADGTHPADAPLVPSVGDAHVENFGLLAATDESLSLEPNDLDAFDWAPYLWDVRRLMLSAAWMIETQTGPRDASTLAALLSPMAEAYARACFLPQIASLRIVAAAEDPIVADLFRRGTRDLAPQRDLEATCERTSSGAWRFRRGVLDPDDPDERQASLPTFVEDSLRVLLTRHPRAPAYPPNYFRLKDAVRKYGSGVTSLPRLRILALVEGASDAPDDDVTLEVKELADHTYGPVTTPGFFFDSLEDRVSEARRLAWSRPDADPLWATTQWFGMPAQLRRQREAHKSVRLARITGALATDEAIKQLGATLGTLVARIHVFGGRLADSLQRAVGPDATRFAAEQVQHVLRYLEFVREDRARLERARARLGSTLGLAPEALHPDVRDFIAFGDSP